MQPSSLVFLILIAIWAAYLLQHWVRRREHLATARSVDRFSEAMHVLERRRALSELDLSAPRPRSYAVSPARPSRPEVVVKRAHALRPKPPTRPASAVRPTRVFRVLAGVSARRLRGLSLLASVLLLLVVSPLAALKALPWWSILVVLAVLVADVGWLHHVAMSGRANVRASSQAGESAESPARLEASPAGYFESGAGADAAVTASEAGAAEIEEPIESPVEADPSGWAPVPVPPPTYTLKARAVDPMVVPAELAEPAAPGTWSLDGMVYDCELEELVERRSATGA